jgi:hypothetical protein
LFGAISSLIYIFDFIKVIEQVQANQVKKLKSRIYNKELELENINFKAGRGGGWVYLSKEERTKLSKHQLDAYLIYQIWKLKIERNKSIKKKSIKYL